ncbi:helix-turn-helix domain-containing protein [Palleronia sp.]
MTTELIDLLKERLRVTSDQELAERLKVGRSTIANWRRRRRVPNDVPLW